MLRDGSCKSLWQYEMPGYLSANDVLPATEIDVIVVGGGITGISTALSLQKSGKSCLVLEAHTIGFGTTSGTTAHLNTLLDVPYTEIENNFGEENARLTATATRMAIEQIKLNIREYGIDCEFKELPAFLFSQNEKQTKELEEIKKASIKAGLTIEGSDYLPVSIPFEKAIKIERQAQFHPAKYLFALAKAFEQSGGIIVQHCRVNRVDENNIVEVDTSLGKLQSKQLIYATHIPPGVNLLHLRNAPYRSYALALELKDAAYPDALIYDMDSPFHYYRTQVVNGKNYLIAGGEDHKTGHEDNTEVCFLRLESYVRKYFDVEAVKYKWSSQYYESADGLPYIGHLPGHPGNLFVATGFGGNGMVYSGVAAKVLTDIILDLSSPYIALFDPNRIKPIAGFSSFVKENLDVAKQFVHKWFSSEKIKQLADLAPGEGKVVKYEDHTLAIYKDESGQLHAVNPTCTHLKCSVNWNTAEQSWDCPCHGARYDAWGKVLNTPADRDLEFVELRNFLTADQ